MRLSRACVLQVFGLSACLAGLMARCMDREQIKVRADRFEHRYQKRLSALTNYTQLPERGLTCEQVAKLPQNYHLQSRALSPWTYRMISNETRFPREIPEARCLCQGCILHQTHDHSYNSVPVYTHLLILTKIPCGNNTSKYKLLKRMERVAVACTCAMPKTQTQLTD